MQKVSKIHVKNIFVRMACMVPVLVLLVFTVGCTHRNKIYAYKEPIVKYEWGEVGGRLNGSGKTTGGRLIGGVSVVGSPYDLSFAPEVRSDEEVKGSATVTGVELYDADKDQLVFKRDDILKSAFEQYELDDKLYKAIFLFEGLDLKYARYRLLIRFKVETDKFVVEDVATLYFEKDYKQYWSNAAWDALMGI